MKQYLQHRTLNIMFCLTEKVFADLVPRCSEEECNGLVKPGKITMQS